MRSLRFLFVAGFLFAAPLAAQATASVCKDGSNSAAVGRGACSGHGGVDAKATAAAEKAAKAAEKAAKAAEKAAKSASKAAEKSSAKVADTKASAAKAEAKADKAVDKAAATQVSCKDGTSSAGGRGACSGHGGIGVTNPAQRQAEKEVTKAAKAETKVDKAEAKAAKVDAKADAKAEKAEAKGGNGSREDNNPVGAIAKCKDGMYSHSAHRRGACSRHGGVASWT